MTLVLDASLTLAWYFEDESTSATDEVLSRVAEKGATVPDLWRLEVANGFQSAVRRKRITVQYRDASLTELSQLPITIDPKTGAHAWHATLQLADRFALTVYDATYLELAHRHTLPLATHDKRLGDAAKQLDLAVLG